MASVFKNALNINLPVTSTIIYTVPAATTSVVHAIFMSNIHASADVNITLQVEDSSGGPATIILMNGVLVPNKTSTVLDKPINLETGDKIIAFASATGSGSIFLSVLEIS